MEIPNPQANGFTIYSKSGCSNCVKVKLLLKEKNATFVVIDCDEYLLEDKAGFLKFIYLLVGKEYKTFPMVFLDGTFMGGFKETAEYFAKIEKELDFNNTDF
jgi:glutaredoxin